MSSPQILSGLRVLDFTQVLSGPTLTRYLVEMGAEVIKIEAPPGGDITRSSATVRDGRSGYYLTVNRGKHSLCIDLKDPRGRAAVLDLVAHVDIVVENFRPGAFDRLGLGYEELRARNPSVILCSVSGFGQTGPMAHLAGYDAVAQAYAGVTSLNGERDQAPVLNGAAVGDVLTGVNGLAAVLGALYWRERTGEGQRVDVSLLGSYMQAHDTSIQSWSMSDGAVVQTRSGRFHQMACPYGIFTAIDGYVMICAASDRHWADLCNAIDQPDLADAGHRWGRRRTREDDKVAVNAFLDAWVLAQPSRDDAVARLQAHRVPAAPVLSIDEVATHQLLRDAGMVGTATDPVIGTLDVPTFPLTFSAVVEDPGGAEAAFLGEHNRAVLVGLGGMPEETFDALVADGILVAEDVRNRPSRRGPASF